MASRLVLTPEQLRLMEAQIRGWFKNDVETETYFGYWGHCDVEGAAKDMARRIADALAEMPGAEVKGAMEDV